MEKKKQRGKHDKYIQFTSKGSDVVMWIPILISSGAKAILLVTWGCGSALWKVIWILPKWPHDRRERGLYGMGLVAVLTLSAGPHAFPDRACF